MEPDEGSLSVDTNPSSGTDFVRATFSHKGRRERESVPALRRAVAGSQDLSDPVVRIVGAAVLDVDQLLAHPHGDGAGCATADEKIAARRTHLADRRDDGGRAAGEGLFELSAGGISAPLVDRVGLLAHARSGILCECDNRITGDA